MKYPNFKIQEGKPYPEPVESVVILLQPPEALFSHLLLQSLLRSDQTLVLLDPLVLHLACKEHRVKILVRLNVYHENVHSYIIHTVWCLIIIVSLRHILVSGISRAQFPISEDINYYQISKGINKVLDWKSYHLHRNKNEDKLLLTHIKRHMKQ